MSWWEQIHVANFLQKLPYRKNTIYFFIGIRREIKGVGEKFNNSAPAMPWTKQDKGGPQKICPF